MNLLGTFEENPCDFGWYEENGHLLPEKFQLHLPTQYTIRCGCKAKCSGRCKCTKYDMPCTEFCGAHCQNV